METYQPSFPQPVPQSPSPPQPPRRNRLGRNAVALIAAATFAAGGIGGAVGALLGGDDAPSATPATSTSTTASATTPTDVSSVVAKVEQSVVQINARTAAGEVIGSGVVVSADGRILTNDHVVAGAEQIAVTLADGRTVEAGVEGTDPGVDLAVIRARGVSGLTPATFADSGEVNVGDEVIAIGSPDGLRGTVTTGIVSALDREVRVPTTDQQSPLPMRGGDEQVSYRAIQTDASINQGNSGGPLFNADGEVIGINSAMYSPVTGPDGSAGSVGIGFAIPSNEAEQVLNQL
jgi:putative serine protease PepD